MTNADAIEHVAIALYNHRPFKISWRERDAVQPYFTAVYRENARVAIEALRSFEGENHADNKSR